jgi:hypothetical protein
VHNEVFATSALKLTLDPSGKVLVNDYFYVSNSNLVVGGNWLHIIHIHIGRYISTYACI